MVAVSGETLNVGGLKALRERMMSDKEGSQILRETPRINSSTVNLAALKKYPPNTLGFQYVKFLDDYVRRNVEP